MLANKGLYLGAALALVTAVIEAHQRSAALAMFALALATFAYTMVPAPLMISRSLAAVHRHRIRCAQNDDAATER